MSIPTVVLDTNVLVAAMRSREGASFALLAGLAERSPPFTPVISVPLVLEYEDAMIRSSADSPLTEKDFGEVIDFLCSVSRHQEIFYLWRPHLRDPGDDMVLEVAFASDADFLVTINVKDFASAGSVGVKVVTPQQLLREIGR